MAAAERYASVSAPQFSNSSNTVGLSVTLVGVPLPSAFTTIAGTSEGLVKLVFRSSDRRLLGAHILGEEASELIHIGQAMLHARATVHEFIDATFNVPTRADAYEYAACDALQHLEARTRNERRRRQEPVPADAKRISVAA